MVLYCEAIADGTLDEGCWWSRNLVVRLIAASLQVAWSNRIRVDDAELSAAAT